MSAIDLKSDLHKILDKIDNEQLLRTIYDFLKLRENSREGEIWKNLSEEQKKEVYLSYEESENAKTLKSWEDLRKKF